VDILETHVLFVPSRFDLSPIPFSLTEKHTSSDRFRLQQSIRKSFLRRLAHPEKKVSTSEGPKVKFFNRNARTRFSGKKNNLKTFFFFSGASFFFAAVLPERPPFHFDPAGQTSSTKCSAAASVSPPRFDRRCSDVAPKTSDQQTLPAAAQLPALPGEIPRPRHSIRPITFVCSLSGQATASRGGGGSSRARSRSRTRQHQDYHHGRGFGVRGLGFGVWDYGDPSRLYAFPVCLCSRLPRLHAGQSLPTQQPLQLLLLHRKQEP